MREAYGRMLAKVIDRHDQAALVGCSLPCFDRLASLHIIPTDFVPDEDAGFFVVYTQEMEAGSSIRMREYEKQVAALLTAHPAVDKVIAMSSYSEYRKGQNLVALKPHNQRAHQRRSFESSIKTWLLKFPEYNPSSEMFR